MLASRHPRADEMDAYERVLGDAMAAEVDQSVSPPGGWQNPTVTS